VQEHCPSPKCPVFSNMRRLAGFALRSFFMVLRCFSLITFRHKRNQSRNVSSAQSGSRSACGGGGEAFLRETPSAGGEEDDGR